MRTLAKVTTSFLGWFPFVVFGCEGAPQALPQPWTKTAKAQEASNVQPSSGAARGPPRDGIDYVLERGETLWDVAHRYGKSLTEIMERNGLHDTDVLALQAGDHLVIPGVSSVPAVPREKQRLGVRYYLESGETIWDLADRFQIAVAEILAANEFEPDEAHRLKEGIGLWIPGIWKDDAGRVHRRLPVWTAHARALARKLGLGTHAAANELFRGAAPGAWIDAAGGTHSLPGTLSWPVETGRYVRGYGSGKGGYHLAVDIAGKIGWTVRSAARGVVAYAGHEIRGYGNIVLVVHPGGWITMYAHNSANHVVAGQEVSRGEILAEVGSTGLSRGPHVHFELMYRGRNCDPMPLFSRTTGVPRFQTQIAWSDPDQRPEAIACNRRRRYPRSEWVIDENPDAL